MLFRLLVIYIVFATAGLQAWAITAPNMSANALFLYRNSNFHKDDVNVTTPDSQPNGFDVREAELQFYADVDPYTRLSLLLSIAPKYMSDGTKVSQEWGIEPEEAFVESNTIPGVTLKGGKFKAALGKHNTLHTHAYAFIEAPLANTKLLGDEGLNDTGVSAAILLPTAWFSEITGQYIRAKGENDEFNSPMPSSAASVVHWKNLFDLSDDVTAELGASYAQGGNSFRGTTTIAGGDLTFKWRPSQGGLYSSVMWATEYLSRNRTQDLVNDEKGSGLASWIQYQFSERWSVLYRYDNFVMKDSFDLTNVPNDTWERNSVALNYAASEFSSFKLEYNRRHGGLPSSSNETAENTFFLQANFTIGAHPAHSY